MKYEIVYTSKFKKSYKLCKRRGFDVSLLKEAIEILATKGTLPPLYNPHILSGKWSGVWECHIKPDWLLLWKQNDAVLELILVATGTHSDIF